VQLHAAELANGAQAASVEPGLVPLDRGEEPERHARLRGRALELLGELGRAQLGAERVTPEVGLIDGLQVTRHVDRRHHQEQRGERRHGDIPSPSQLRHSVTPCT